ncbi:MAG: type I-C CRISPR-associated protein Cas8c/Csd1, partial [Desulforhabdus sp.]|nr:type I-C CRISPR-associated protein Cas8c/Csd1 [Desulforhabdus sp.]
MILQALNKYYDRLSSGEEGRIPVFGFARQKIHFCLVLSPSGELLDVQDLRVNDGKRMVPVELVVPEPVKRTVAIAPNFLWDNTRYVLGADSGGNPQRAWKAFDAFKQSHHAIGDRLDDHGIAALLAFLDNWIPAEAPNLKYWQEMAGQNLVFRLEGEHRFLHECFTLQKAWSDHYSESDEDFSAVCLISGTEGPIARLHPSVKGVAGAQSSGAALVSFNLDAFTSYGKTQNYNAPIGERGAFGYTTALNWLLRNGSRQKIRIGDATVVFWAERKTFAETLLAGLLDPGFGADMEDAEQEAPLRDLRVILEAARKGRIQDTVDEPEVPFYILGLSPNASRISVRFWHVSTAGDIVANIGRHFNDMAIVKSFANI